MREVLNLKKHEQDDFAELLEKTKLSSIIKTTSLVVDRIKFIDSLDPLLYGEYKQQLLETQQLHKMLLENLWIFGEQYQIKNSDQFLTSVLEEHIGILGREQLVPDVPSNQDISDISDDDLKKLRIDLMLYTQIPSPTLREHLVVELKRPTVKIGEKEITQIKKYARAVYGNPRFDKSRTRWKFLLLGNELSEYALYEANQLNRPPGVVEQHDNLTAHVKTWAEIIHEAKWRYGIYYEYLMDEASKNDTLEHLQK